MSEKDYVGDIGSVSYSGVFDYDGLYKSMRKWFSRYKYDLTEKDYREFKEEGKNKLHIKWIGDRKVTDYLKYIIEVEMKIDDMVEVMVKNKKKIKGDISIRFVAYILKDYEETWYKSAVLKFFREAYDKFGKGSEMENMNKELRNEGLNLAAEIKTFLNMRKN